MSHWLTTENTVMCLLTTRSIVLLENLAAVHKVKKFAVMYGN
jgi:hypothetical protein